MIANLASSYDNVGRPNEALKLREQALELARKALGPENQKTLTAMGDLALSYDNTGRHDEAATLEEQLLPLSQKVRGPEDRETLGVINHLAIFYEKAGRTNEALKLREQALPLDRKALGPDSPETLSAINELARFYADAGRNEERLKLTEEALALSVKNDPDSEATGDNYAWYGYALDAVGRGDESIKAWQEAVRIGPAARQREAHYWLGRNLMKRKRYAEALPSLRTAQEQYPYDDRGLEAGGLLAFAEAVTNTSENPQEGSTRGAPASGPFTAWLTAVRAPVDGSAVVDEKAMHLATLYCWLGRTNEHQALCRKLLELAGPSQDPGPHDLAAKACLVQAHPGPELLKLAIASGRQGLALAATNNQWRTWFLITAGLAELRDAQPAKAEALLTEALSDSKIIPDEHALALAYRAIAGTHLGQTNEARADFAALEKLAPPLPPHDSFSPGLAEINPLITCIAYEEAKAVLNPPGAPHP